MKHGNVIKFYYTVFNYLYVKCVLIGDSLSINCGLRELF